MTVEAFTFDLSSAGSGLSIPLTSEEIGLGCTMVDSETASSERFEAIQTRASYYQVVRRVAMNNGKKIVTVLIYRKRG